MKKVYSIKKLYRGKFPIMFFTSFKKAVESAKVSSGLLSQLETVKDTNQINYSYLNIGDSITYIGVKSGGIAHDIVIESHLVH